MNPTTEVFTAPARKALRKHHHYTSKNITPTDHLHRYIHTHTHTDSFFFQFFFLTFCIIYILYTSTKTKTISKDSILAFLFLSGILITFRCTLRLTLYHRHICHGNLPFFLSFFHLGFVLLTNERNKSLSSQWWCMLLYTLKKKFNNTTWQVFICTYIRS